MRRKLIISAAAVLVILYIASGLYVNRVSDPVSFLFGFADVKGLIARCAEHCRERPRRMEDSGNERFCQNKDTNPVWHKLISHPQ